MAPCADTQNELTEAAKRHSISDRILLVEEIWDTIAEENQAFELADTQRREPDWRLEAANTHPGQGRTRNEIKAEFMESLGMAQIVARIQPTTR